jgi:hypothetical protein
MAKALSVTLALPSLPWSLPPFCQDRLRFVVIWHSVMIENDNVSLRHLILVVMMESDNALLMLVLVLVFKRQRQVRIRTRGIITHLPIHQRNPHTRTYPPYNESLRVARQRRDTIPRMHVKQRHTNEYPSVSQSPAQKGVAYHHDNRPTTF